MQLYIILYILNIYTQDDRDSCCWESPLPASPRAAGQSPFPSSFSPTQPAPQEPGFPAETSASRHPRLVPRIRRPCGGRAGARSNQPLPTSLNSFIYTAPSGTQRVAAGGSGRKVTGRLEDVPVPASSPPRSRGLPLTPV